MKSYDTRENGTLKVSTVNTEPSKTDQSFAKDCDVNHIMKQYSKTGQFTHLAKFQGQYADVSEIPDLTEALNSVNRAQTAFDELPATLRERFNHNPVEMVNFLQNPQNDAEAVHLGLKVILNPDVTPPDKSSPGGDIEK